MRHAPLSFLALLLTLPTPASAAFEREPVLDTASLVSPALMNGPGYAVAPQARVTGYQARFVIRTPHGEIEAGSVEMLAVRIAEMPAVEALHREEASAVLAKSATQAVGDAGAALLQVARHPVQTLAGLPRGVARYFGERVRKVGERARKLATARGARSRRTATPTITRKAR